MDDHHFDDLGKIFARPSRRGVLSTMGAAILSVLFGSTPEEVGARQKRKGHNAKGKRKGNGKRRGNTKSEGQDKVTICHKGQTMTVAKPALKGHLRHGDAEGPCETTSPPPPPSCFPACSACQTCDVAGQCVSVVCTALDACHVAGTCDPVTGVCSNPPKCAEGETCQNDGTCVLFCPSGLCPPTYACDEGICKPCDVCPSGCAFTSVQEAVEANPQLSTIQVCPGTYVGDVGLFRPVTIIGAGDGPYDVTSTILVGTGGQPVVLSSSNGEVRLQSVRIAGGNAQGDAPGIRNGSTLTVIASTVAGNTGINGGGIDNAGTLILIDSTVTENNAALDGGGIYNRGSLALRSTDVTNNEAGDQGGGIYNVSGGFVSIDYPLADFSGTFSQVTGNTSVLDGGGIYTENGNVALAFTEIVWGNTNSHGSSNCFGEIPNCINV